MALPLSRWLAVFAATAFVAPASPTFAEDVPVDLELVLAVDVSGSMDIEERKLQRDGYVDAFLHPDVIVAITSGLTGKIAVAYVEWAGPKSQTLVMPWRLVDGKAAAEAVSAELAQAESPRIRGTSISAALAFSGALFQDNGFSGSRQVVDISGDGPNNMGPPVVPMREAMLARGITINGLPLTLHPGTMFGLPAGLLDIYYEDCVIGGPGAFSISVQAPEQLAEAIRRKLVLEIAGREPEIVQAELAQMAPRIDCLIGEKTRPEFLDENR
ncbi:MAG: DUF1194 domain-containing protein [Dongiaceae bacterium]